MIVNGNVLNADEGKTFARKSDNVILGPMLTLGVKDSISNYTEVPIIEPSTEDEKAEALRILGVTS